MKLQKKIFWCSCIISILTVILFIAFETIWSNCKNNGVISGIMIAIFGSSLMVAIPTFLLFDSVKRQNQQKISTALANIENLINDIHFQTTFMRDFDGNFNFDFSFEIEKYKPISDLGQYMIKRDYYEIISKKITTLYSTFKNLKSSDFSVFDDIEDYVGLFNSEKEIHNIGKIYWLILKPFLLSYSNSAIEYGARQFQSKNATVGQFFDIWFKNYLISLGDIGEKLEDLRILLIFMKILFKKNKNLKEIKKSKDNEQIKQLKIYMERIEAKYEFACPLLKKIL